MAVQTFTSFNDIRAALGVEDDEIRDDTLSLDLYSNHLDAELEDVSVNLSTDYATVAAISAEARTATEARLYRCTRQFATFAVAKLALTGLALAAPKEVSDEKTTVTRFALDPYKETGKRVESAYSAALERLRQAYADYKSSTASSIVLPTLLGAAGLSVDPVTNA